MKKFLFFGKFPIFEKNQLFFKFQFLENIFDFFLCGKFTCWACNTMRQDKNDAYNTLKQWVYIYGALNKSSETKYDVPHMHVVFQIYKAFYAYVEHVPHMHGSTCISPAHHTKFLVLKTTLLDFEVNFHLMSVNDKKLNLNYTHGTCCDPYAFEWQEAL